MVQDETYRSYLVQLGFQVGPPALHAALAEGAIFPREGRHDDVISGRLPEHDSAVVISSYVVAEELDVGRCASRNRAVLGTTSAVVYV